MNKKSLLSVYFLFLCLMANAQLISIEEAKTMPEGATVTVKGIVTAGGELGAVRYMQDETAGIAIYDPSTVGAEVFTGDSLEITGQLTIFNELIEIVDDGVGEFEFNIISSGNELPAPATVSMDEGFQEEYEGMLVRFEQLSFTETGTFSGNTNYDVTDGNSTNALRVSNSTDIPGLDIPEEPTDMVGIMGQYNEYQLLPRTKEDLGIETTVEPPSGLITIAEARDMTQGSIVTVKGIVLNGNELGPIRYIQDETAGLAIYNPGDFSDNTERGDSIFVTATLGEFNMLLQLVDDPNFEFEVINSGNELPEPPTLSFEEGYNEDYESQLVSFNNVFFEDSGIFEGNTNYNINDGNSTEAIRTNSNSNIPGVEIPSDDLPMIMGIMSRYQENFQLLPRDLVDLGLEGVEPPSGLMTIAQARALPDGSTVTVMGIVTNGAELGVVRYMQDETGGIAIYNPDDVGENVFEGDSILITGQLDTFRELLEIVDDGGDFEYEVLSSDNDLPDPVVLNPEEVFTEEYESQLVRIEDVQFQDIGSTFAGNTNYLITDATGNYEERIVNTTDIVDTPIPAAGLGITGIMSQYQATYQMLPRRLDDIDTLSTPPLFISPISQSNITTSSVNIDFVTYNEGDAVITYGLSEDDLTLGSATSSDLTTDHSVPIDGLAPATLYYVQVTTTSDSGDSSTSPIVPMITASESSGEILVYFNRDVETSVATVEDAIYLPNAVDDTLRAYIDRAKYTIDMMMYTGDNLNGVINALNAAEDRGVELRFVLDKDFNEDVQADLPGTFTKRVPMPAGEPDGIMHNKVLIIDAESEDPNDPLVWTGSTNFTSNQLLEAANNVIIIQDQSLAKVYTMEFEEMFEGTFGAFKTNNTPTEFNIGGNRVECYFSPSDQVTSNLKRTMDTADEELYWSILSFTRTDIVDEIVSESVFPDNAFVAGMMDSDSGADSTTYAQLNLALNVIVIEDENSYQLHHKYFIVDPNEPDMDPLVWTGSHNWSNTAELRNDENSLVVHDERIANIYFQEWVARYLDNGGTVFYEGVTVSVRETDNDSYMEVYPNPAKHTLNVNFFANSREIANMQITNVNGQVLYQQDLSLAQENQAIDIRDWPAGIYFVQINNHTEKFIITK